MQITLGPELSNNKRRLDFIHNTKSIPAYTIDKTQADEFIKKYNSQNSNLNKMSAAFTFIGAVSGYKMSGKSVLSKIFKGIPLGLTFGFMLSAFISYNLKNKLMKKYRIEGYI